MATVVITVDELEQFKTDVIQEIKNLVEETQKTGKSRWLKNSDVKRMLKMSSSTLQTLRSNGTLSFTKIGGIIYYDREEIEKILEENLISNRL